MTRSRLFLVAWITISFVIAAAAFRTSSPERSITATSLAGSLIPATPMLEPRSGHSATLLPDGKVLIAGGMRRNQDFYKSAELYDPATGKFAPIAKMTTPRGRPSATLLSNGDVLIAGGEVRDNQSLASAEIFHASTLTFQPTGSMHEARISHTATLLADGRVLIAGGYADSIESAAELYDPKGGTFTATGSLTIARCKHTAGLLPDGRVLVAGGSNSRAWNGNLSSTEIYDPLTGKFTAGSPMNDSRFKLPDEAVQLPSGKLLIAGGSRQVEIFDPESQKFLVAAGQMNNPWHYASETRLRDGSVLLAGGYSNDPEATAQAWIYRP